MDYICHLFIYFIIYSFIGWVLETCLCSIMAKKFINRGFLNGPFCPIYGNGSIIIILLLSGLARYPVLVFVYGLIICSILEYLTGLMLETVFKTKYWDYSMNKFNIQGRVCLQNSILFGIGGVLLIEFVQPSVSRLVSLVPSNIIGIVSAVFATYFLADTIITVCGLFNLNSKLKHLGSILSEIANKMSELKNLNGVLINKQKIELIQADLEKLHERQKKIEQSLRLFNKTNN